MPSPGHQTCRNCSRRRSCSCFPWSLSSHSSPPIHPDWPSLIRPCSARARAGRRPPAGRSSAVRWPQSPPVPNPVTAQHGVEPVKTPGHSLGSLLAGPLAPRRRSAGLVGHVGPQRRVVPGRPRSCRTRRSGGAAPLLPAEAVRPVLGPQRPSVRARVWGLLSEGAGFVVILTSGKPSSFIAGVHAAASAKAGEGLVRPGVGVPGVDTCCTAPEDPVLASIPPVPGLAVRLPFHLPPSTRLRLLGLARLRD